MKMKKKRDFYSMRNLGDIYPLPSLALDTMTVSGMILKNSCYFGAVLVSRAPK